MAKALWRPSDAPRGKCVWDADEDQHHRDDEPVALSEDEYIRLAREVRCIADGEHGAFSEYLTRREMAYLHWLYWLMEKGYVYE